MRSSLNTVFKIATLPTPYNSETPNLPYPGLFSPYHLITHSAAYLSYLILLNLNLEVIKCSFNYNDHFKLLALFFHSLNKQLSPCYVFLPVLGMLTSCSHNPEGSTLPY